MATTCSSTAGFSGLGPAGELDRGGYRAPRENGQLAEHWDVIQDEGDKGKHPSAACRCSAISSRDELAARPRIETRFSQGAQRQLATRPSRIGARVRLWGRKSRFRITLLHGSAVGRRQPPASTFHVRRTYSGRPSSSMRFSEATAMATPRSSAALRSAKRSASTDPRAL